jgi:hypothetical protein
VDGGVLDSEEDSASYSGVGCEGPAAPSADGDEGSELDRGSGFGNVLLATSGGVGRRTTGLPPGMGNGDCVATSGGVDMRAGIVSPGVQMYMGGGDGVDISL